jgi:hypothetical protein
MDRRTLFPFASAGFCVVASAGFCVVECGSTPIGAAAMYESAADVRMDFVEVGSALLLLPIGRCAWTFSTTTIYTKTT